MDTVIFLRSDFSFFANFLQLRQGKKQPCSRNILLVILLKFCIFYLNLEELNFTKKNGIINI